MATSDASHHESTAPNVRGRGAWWYLAILGVLILTGIIGAIMFFSDPDRDGITFGWIASLPVFSGG